MLTFLKSNAASISSITYNGVGLYRWRANTSANEESVFSPPERLLMFFHDFFGGITENRIPSENGSKESTSSSSAFPPMVIIWYICFNVSEIWLKPAMNSSSLCFLRFSHASFNSSRFTTDSFKSAFRSVNSLNRLAYSCKVSRSTVMESTSFSSSSISASRVSGLTFSSSSGVYS
ncbi:hypothetical protein OGAPHI_001587 [Ogataea philodendri]|uniref:Uncharacterized protein n=1 Tax=Ogataea philodendri TaxID=1378263 RepID=A0A9P8T833_9ASCO|nr:uncharacterized protein OGAPHI_001587 [Ogataea philodendri]KAH3669466.1 hypothetical protein OGAPHI_001587 [Ogataea philodendri]